MTLRFEGKTIIVAGGTGGLGRAVTLAFLDEGANVAVTYRHEDEFSALRQSAVNASGTLRGHNVDVADESAVTTFVEEIAQQHGQLDALVNTIGAYAGGIPLWSLPSATFEQMLSLNLRSGFNLARAVLPAMRKQQHGSIVNIAAKAALDHGAGASAYAASKSAAVAMMDSLAEDLRGSGVRVNSILPSIIDTPANRKAMPDSDFSTWPKPEDIARVILFLCSEDANVIHGASIPVFGAY